MIVWHGYEIDFPKLKDTDMADLQKYTSDLGNALSRELLKFNSQLASMQDNIEDLEAETAQNDSDLEETKTFIENSMKTLSAEGSSIHVADSADYPCSLRVEGKSEQVQTEQSANLADADVLYKDMETYNDEDLSEKTVDGKECIEFKNSLYRNDQGFTGLQGNYKENTQYTVRGLFRISDTSITSGKKIYFGAVYTDDTRNTVATEANGENWTELRILTSADKTLKGVYFTYDQVSLWLLDKSSLCIAEGNVTEYPAFVPDSPSPNYPSEIENVSGDLEIKTVAKNLMKCETDVQTKFGVTITKTDDGGYILNGTSTGVGSNGITLVSFEHNFPLLKNNSYAYSIGFENVPNKRVSFPIAAKQVDGTIKHNYKSINTESATAPVVFIPSEDLTTNNVAVYIRNGTVFNNFKFKIQIEEGTVATDYEPYKEQKVTFPLGTQKLMKDGHLGDDGIHNKRKQVVLDGTESWFLSGRQFEKCACFHIGIDNNPKINMLCNAFKYNQMAYNNSTDEECITNNATSGIQNIIIVQIDKTRLATQDVAGFKAWLAEQYSAGTPVIVEYEMETEETTAYTEQQETAYNTLQKLKTYRTVTNISNSQNTNMQLTYKMDLQTQIAGGGSSA